MMIEEILKRGFAHERRSLRELAELLDFDLAIHSSKPLAGLGDGGFPRAIDRLVEPGARVPFDDPFARDRAVERIKPLPRGPDRGGIFRRTHRDCQNPECTTEAKDKLLNFLELTFLKRRSATPGRLRMKQPEKS